MLRDTFIQLAGAYTDDNAIVVKYWAEIEKRHTAKGRHYHTLEHLDNLVKQLAAIREEITDWDTLLFSVFYHDIVYDVLKKDNEEQSAVLAAERLTAITVPALQVEKCKVQILATRAHQYSEDSDTNLFTDADLSILGHDWPLYEIYCKQVRKEYGIYPGIVYKPGRKNVLRHFLEMDRIFKTAQFYDKYEIQARENLKRELDSL